MKYALIYRRNGADVRKEYASKSSAVRAMRKMRNSGQFNSVAAWWIVRCEP